MFRRRWLRDQQRSRLYGEHIMAQDLKSVSSNASFDPETVPVRFGRHSDETNFKYGV
jgi:hypothetical protein